MPRWRVTARTRGALVALLCVALAAPSRAQDTSAPPLTLVSSPLLAQAPRPPVVIGPPAPVPPQVAMLRPGPDEVAQINAAVQRLVESDTSAARETLKKYGSLLMLQPPRPNTAATYTQTVQRMGPRHEGFVATAAAGSIDLLMLGDSITDWWVQNDENRAVFQKYFENIRTANFAVAGDTTQGVLWGLRNGEGQGFQPKAVMLMIGTNNTGTHTAPEIAEGIGAIELELRQNFPNAKVLLLAVFNLLASLEDRLHETLDFNRRVILTVVGLGMLTALLFLSEYSAGLVAVVIGGYLAWRLRGVGRDPVLAVALGFSRDW